MCLGKSGKQKPKNTKKKPESKSQPPYKIPKNKPLFEPESDDESLGQDKISSISVNKKFACEISSYINSSALLPCEMYELCNNFESLVVESTSKQTWKRHCSAWALYHNFCKSYNVKTAWPVSVKYARAFATWALSVKLLKSSTIKSYLSSLNVAHTLSDLNVVNLNADNCIKMLLKGAVNVYDATVLPKPTRLAMNVELLEILGHRLNELNWSTYSKQVVWTACIISFFTSCRMGELLCAKIYENDSKFDLLWGGVKFLSNNEAIILIPFTKTTGYKGCMLDVFPTKNSKICPALALLKLKKLAEKEGNWNSEKSVFSFSSGKNLTKAALNKILAMLLSDFSDENHKITGHSFRAAIPSALASHPDKGKVKLVKEWGRWESNSYRIYANLDRNKKRSIFEIVNECI